MVIIFICIILLVILGLYFILRKDRFENQDKKKLDVQQNDSILIQFTKNLEEYF